MALNQTQKTSRNPTRTITRNDFASLIDGKSGPAASGGAAIEEELIVVGEPGVSCKF